MVPRSFAVRGRRTAKSSTRLVRGRRALWRQEPVALARCEPRVPQYRAARSAHAPRSSFRHAPRPVRSLLRSLPVVHHSVTRRVSCHALCCRTACQRSLRANWTVAGIGAQTAQTGGLSSCTARRHRGQSGGASEPGCRVGPNALLLAHCIRRCVMFIDRIFTRKSQGSNDKRQS